MSFPLKVELHRHFEDPMNLTSFVGAVTWSVGVRGDGGAAVTLRLPIRAWQRVGLEPGHLIVIRLVTSGEAVWWGYIREVRSGRSVGVSGPPHEIATLPVEVICDQFTDLLARSRVLLAPGLQYTVEGAIYQFKSWGPAFKAWGASLSTTNPGELLGQAFQALARQPLPESLGGEALGDAVSVAWSDEGYLLGDEGLRGVPSELAGRHYAVPGFAINSFSNILPGGTIWGMLHNTFRADPMLVEMFHAVYPLAEDRRQTALEKTLQRSSRIVYRMAPLHPTRAVTGPGAVDSGLFQQEPEALDVRWYARGGEGVKYARTEWTFTSDALMNWSISWSEDDRRNGFHTDTVIQPDSQMPAYGIIGTPVVDNFDARVQGLRFFEASWPFFPTTDAEDLVGEDGAIVKAIDALTEYSAHCLQNGHERGKGTLHLRPNFNIRPGLWAQVQVYPGIVLTCYMLTVTHSVQVGAEQGRTTSHTEVTFTQGSLKDIDEAYLPTPTRYQTESVEPEVVLAPVQQRRRKRTKPVLPQPPPPAPVLIYGPPSPPRPKQPPPPPPPPAAPSASGY